MLGKYDLRGDRLRLKWQEFIEHGKKRMKAVGVTEIPDVREVIDSPDVILRESLFDEISEEEIEAYCRRVGIKREEFCGGTCDRETAGEQLNLF